MDHLDIVAAARQEVREPMHEDGVATEGMRRVEPRHHAETHCGSRLAGRDGGFVDGKSAAWHGASLMPEICALAAIGGRRGASKRAGAPGASPAPSRGG
jgi:hypothetical protein